MNQRINAKELPINAKRRVITVDANIFLAMAKLAWRNWLKDKCGFA